MQGVASLNGKPFAAASNMAHEIFPQEAVPAADAASGWPSDSDGPDGSDLKRRIWFTLGALIVFRLGTFVPLSGIDAEALAQVFQQQAGGLFGLFDLLAGGALFRMAIFALGLVPYISALAVLRILTALSQRLAAIGEQGSAGREKLHQIAKCLTVALCLLQSYGLAVGLEGSGAAMEPGMAFRLTTAATLTAGTLFLVWLGGEINRRGLGLGISLILFSGIAANLPMALAGAAELGRIATPIAALSLFVMALVMVCLMVLIDRAQRRIIVQAPKREPSHLPLKLNSAGVIPPLFASAMMLAIPLIGPIAGRAGGEAADWAATLLARGQPLQVILYGALIVVFAFLGARDLLDPAATATMLKKQGSFIPGIRPGEQTAAYLAGVLPRLTTIGAAFLVVVCALPEIFLAKVALPVAFSGIALLILVVVTIETSGAIYSHIRMYRS